jgi:hypothetical protein
VREIDGALGWVASNSRKALGKNKVVPFVELRRGDVVLSQEAWRMTSTILTVRAYDSYEVVEVKLAVRKALLRGGR